MVLGPVRRFTIRGWAAYHTAYKQRGGDFPLCPLLLGLGATNSLISDSNSLRMKTILSEHHSQLYQERAFQGFQGAHLPSSTCISLDHRQKRILRKPQTNERLVSSTRSLLPPRTPVGRKMFYSAQITGDEKIFSTGDEKIFRDIDNTVTRGISALSVGSGRGGRKTLQPNFPELQKLCPGHEAELVAMSRRSGRKSW
jgi:hypothetical protein